VVTDALGRDGDAVAEVVEVVELLADAAFLPPPLHPAMRMRAATGTVSVACPIFTG
jgi:hypothetical protein